MPKSKRPDRIKDPVTGLSPAEEVFCREYIATANNATEAALRAGFGKTRLSASVPGCTMLKDQAVINRILELTRERSAQLEMTSNETLSEIANIARGNVAELFTPQGQLRHISDLPIHVQKAIKSIKVVTKETVSQGKVVDVEYVHEIKMHDKLKGLELTGKTQALFIERMEVNHTHELAELGEDEILKLVAGLTANSAVSDIVARINEKIRSDKNTEDVPG